MFEKLLADFHKIPKVRIEENWFSICGFSHYEKVASNVLQFFLDSSREHYLKDLFIRSLLSFTESLDIQKEAYFLVTTEFQTKKGNFIDLLLKSETHCIVIENKINSWVYNDLNDYFETAATQAPKVSAFVLSLRKQPPIDSKWIYITYADLFERIKSNIGEYLIQGNRRYLDFFFEFIENIETLAGAEKMDEEFVKFLSTNQETVQELIRKTNDVRNELRKRVQQVGALIKERVDDKRLCQWEWREPQEIYDIAVSDIEHKTGKITVHSELFLDGWHFSVFPRKNSYPINDLLTICSDLGIVGNIKNGRIVLVEQFDFSTQIDIVSEYSSKIICGIMKKCSV